MNKILVFLGLIFLLSVFLRFFMLSSNPPSLNWDEASLGYNAYSILKTGADEYGNRFPLSFRSFDDYKPPVYVYLAVPSVLVFGLTELAVRFPSVLFGSITVLAVYFLVLEIFRFKTNTESKFLLNIHDKIKPLALIAAFFVSISPWHLQFSRAAYEGNIAVSFFVLGMLFFLIGLRNGKFLILASIFFGISMYSYHSFRIICPIFILFLTGLFYKEIFKKKYYLISSFFICLTFIGGFAFSFFDPGGAGSRLSMVTIFDDKNILKDSQEMIIDDKLRNDFFGEVVHNRRIVYLQNSLKGYFDHFNPDFLFFNGDSGVQHHAYKMGMMYYFDILLLIFGGYYLLRLSGRPALIIFGLLILAPIPSSVTTGTPHPVRAIAMIPVLQIIMAVGAVSIFYKITKFKNSLKIVILAPAGFFIIMNIFYYFHQYHIHTPTEYGYFWQYGNKEALAFAKNLENTKDKIVMTYRYDQPYIFYLFYNKIDPEWYQKNWDYLGTGNTDRFERKIGKYEFRNINFQKDQNIKNALLIGAPDEFPHNVNYLKKIHYLDGEIAYKIVETNEK